MEGSEGMANMRKLMSAFRTHPPKQLGGIPVAAVRDYQALTVTPVGGSSAALEAPRSDMVMLDLAESGNYFAVRPSGTEPKVKFYTFASSAPTSLAEVAAQRSRLKTRLSELERDIRQFVNDLGNQSS